MTEPLTPAQLAAVDQDIAGANAWLVKMVTAVRHAIDEGEDPGVAVLKMTDWFKGNNPVNLAANLAAAVVWIAQHREGES